MKCLLCESDFLSEEVLKNHYIYNHKINETDAYFNDLFMPDTVYRDCNIGHIKFQKARSRKNHMFLFQYVQMGGSRQNFQRPINVLKGGLTTYYTIANEQHKDFYDVFGDGIVENFLNSVYARYNPNKENKIQGYAKIINRQ